MVQMVSRFGSDRESGSEERTARARLHVALNWAGNGGGGHHDLPHNCYVKLFHIKMWIERQISQHTWSNKWITKKRRIS
jgi:hypothetical protein